MARNSSGTDAAVNGPYVSGTTISSSAVNARFSDAETELTDSLSRSGKGGMLAALRGVDGTVAAPAVSFTSDTGTGFFRAAASDLRASIAGTAVFKWLASSLVSLFPHTFIGSAADAPVILTPLAAPSTPSNGGLWVETTSNVAKVRINGSTKTILTSPIVRGDLPALAQQTSTACGSFGTTSATYVDVTNLTVTFTPTGRPVMVFLQPDGTNVASINVNGTASDGTLAILRDGAVIAEFKVRDAQAAASLPFQPLFLDTAATNASHTWKMQAKVGGAVNFAVLNYVLVAYET